MLEVKDNWDIMFLVEIDKLKNILKLTFESNVNEQEARQCFEKVEIFLLQIEPGFKILTDLRKVETIAVSAATHIEHIMDACNKKGVSKVVRVIPDPSKDIGFNIMSIFHYSHGIPIITCPTMIEALDRLSPKQESV